MMNDMKKRNAMLLAPNGTSDSISSERSLNSQSQNATNFSSSQLLVPSITIASTFRLMAALERQNPDELIEYLGIPILSISKEDLIDYKTSQSSMLKFRSTLSDEQKRVVCDSLFLSELTF